MDNKEKILNLISEIGIDEIKKVIEEKEKLPKRQGVSNMVQYFYVDATNEVNYFTECRCTTDEHLFKMRNYFRTIEEASEYVKYRCIRAKLLNITEELNADNPIDWSSDTQPKYYIAFNGEYISQAYTKTPILDSALYCTSSTYFNELLKEIKESDLIWYLKNHHRFV